MQSTKTNKKTSSARTPGAQKKAAAVSSSKLDTSDVAPSEVEANAKKVSPPAKAGLALEGWGLASNTSSDEEDEGKAKPAAVKKGMASGGKAAKGRAPSKDRYLLPAGKKHAKREDEKAKPEADDQFMPGAAAAGVGELLLTSFDPFADAERGDYKDGGAPAAPRDDVVHLRTQQRNGRKSLTTVQGLSAAYNYAKILRDLKRELCCSGIVVEDEDLGNVVQLQGDHRKAVAAFLVKAGIVSKANVKIHGS